MKGAKLKQKLKCKINEYQILRKKKEIKPPNCSGPIPAQKIKCNSVPLAVFSKHNAQNGLLFSPSFLLGKTH